jgi:hypothetical protein
MFLLCSSSAGQLLCSLCGSGRYAAVNGSTDCAPCNKGEFQPEGAQVNISSCVCLAFLLAPRPRFRFAARLVLTLSSG